MRIEENISLFGRVSVNFLEISKEIFELYEKQDEVTRQKNSPHLGLISKAFKGINHSRWEYLILQCVLSELIDNNLKGTSNTQGSLKILGTEYLGNDIIKSWILISNFGHCKNTIGDEKAILLFCVQNKSFKRKVLSSIKDIELRRYAQIIIEKFDYVNFHHILSIIRIYKSTKKRVIFRNKILIIYKLLLLSYPQLGAINSSKVAQLRSIYRNIRNISIISLDSKNSSLPINIDILSLILSYSFIENRYNETKIDDLLNPIKSLLYDSLYLNEDSQTFQRDYEIKAYERLRDIHLKNTFDSIFNESLFSGLSEDFIVSYKHFLRVKLNANHVENVNLNGLIRTANTVKRELLSIVDSSVDYNPFSNEFSFDFYYSKLLFKKENMVKFLFNIESVLDKQLIGTIDRKVESNRNLIVEISKKFSEREFFSEIKEFLNTLIVDEAINEIKKKNFHSYKNILWAFLKFHLIENYYFDIEHHITEDYNFFGVKVGQGLDILSSELNKAIFNEIDSDRKHELIQLKKSVERKFDGVVIACLNRVTIYDYSQAPNKRIKTDIDSLILKMNSNTIIFEIHESKNTKSPESDAIKDINSKLKVVLNKSFCNYKIKTVKGMGAKVVYRYSI